MMRTYVTWLTYLISIALRVFFWFFKEHLQINTVTRGVALNTCCLYTGTQTICRIALCMLITVPLDVKWLWVSIYPEDTGLSAFFPLCFWERKFGEFWITLFQSAVCSFQYPLCCNDHYKERSELFSSYHHSLHVFSLKKTKNIKRSLLWLILAVFFFFFNEGHIVVETSVALCCSWDC